MEFRQLRYFISVAEHLNFTEASKQLFLEQSAVSQQIAKLEKQLGVKLFTRNKRSVQLTNAGTIFLKEATEIINKCEEAAANTRKAEAGLMGSLQIGFLVAPVRGFLPEVIRQFNSKYPNIEIKLNHHTTRYLNDGLNTNDLDIVFTISLGLNNITGLECKTIFSDSTSIFMHHRHPLAQKESIHMAELSREPFIIRDRDESPEWYDYTLMLCAKNGFSPNIVSQTRRVEAVLMLVDAGMGIAVFPEYLKMYSIPSLRSIKVEDQKDALDIVVYRKKTNNNPSIPLFLEVLDSVLSAGTARACLLPEVTE